MPAGKEKTISAGNWPKNLVRNKGIIFIKMLCKILESIQWKIILSSVANFVYLARFPLGFFMQNI